MRFWVGGYTADMDGGATGIGELRAGAVDDLLAGGPLGFAGTAVVTDGSPSWLTAHPFLDVVYAAMEGAGTVQAFRRTGESSFAPLGAPVAAGELVCHVAVAPDGGFLLASCWGDGSVVRMSLDAAGRPSQPRLAPAAGDPYASEGMLEPPPAADLDLAAAARALREAAGDEYAHLVPDVAAEPAAPADSERSSRSHQAVFLPAGRAATVDMGLDQVRVWAPGGSGLRSIGRVVLPRGCGPRRVLHHPSGHLYVLTELSDEIFVLRPDPSTGSGTGGWRIVASTSLSPAALPGVDLAAELTASRDGRFLYAGMRGSNTIATVRVTGEGDRLAPVALSDSGVDWPRHHAVERDTLLVAGQRSDDVVSLTLDERTGVPGRIRHRAEVPSPSCLLAAR